MKPNDPTDLIGNPIQKGDVLAVYFKNTPLAIVIAVEGGGIHTPNGVTPAVIRVVIDMTLKQQPGTRFESLLKVQNPNSQQLLEGIADSLPKG